MPKRGLPSAALATQLASSGLSLEQASRLAADALMHHELGHNVAQAYGIGAPNSWLNEFIANYLAHAYESDTRADPRAPLLAAVRREWFASLTPAHTALEDLERLYLGVGIENYGWYQSQFEARVADVYTAQGLGFVSRLRDAFPLKNRHPRPVAEVLGTLETITPGWHAWADSLGRTGKP